MAVKFSITSPISRRILKICAHVGYGRKSAGEFSISLKLWPTLDSTNATTKYIVNIKLNKAMKKQFIAKLANPEAPDYVIRSSVDGTILNLVTASSEGTRIRISVTQGSKSIHFWMEKTDRDEMLRKLFLEYDDYVG